MARSQFSIKILGVHFANSVLDNSNWDKINHSLPKKNHYLKQTATLSWMKKKKKKKIVNQILLSKRRSNGQSSKTYQKGNSKNNSSTLHLEMWTRYFRHKYSIKLCRTYMDLKIFKFH